MSLNKTVSTCLATGVDIVWPCQEARDFRAKNNKKDGERSGALHSSESQHLLSHMAQSLKDVGNVTVQLSDVEAGVKDLAELRSDGNGSFYSNFTAQHLGYPRLFSNCPMFCYPLRMSWSFWAFIVSALHQLLFNTEAMSLAVLGCAATFFCSEEMLDFRCTYQTSAIFIGLIFPLVFLIGQTYLRREKAIERLASMKANAVQLILKLIIHSSVSSALMVIETTRALFEDIRHFLPQDSLHSGLRVSGIYGRFAALQKEPECAMLTRFMLVEFEKLRMQREYRTPWKLNYFCFLCGTFAPIGMAPLFASMGCQDRFPVREKTDPSQSCGYGTPGAYLTSFFFAIVMSSLLSIVKAMEDPFSLDGPDDVISSFSFETNALLHLVEDHQPGSLEKEFDTFMPPSTKKAPLCGGTQKRRLFDLQVGIGKDSDDEMRARQDLARLQGMVDDDEH